MFSLTLLTVIAEPAWLNKRLRLNKLQYLREQKNHLFGGRQNEWGYFLNYTWQIILEGCDFQVLLRIVKRIPEGICVGDAATWLIRQLSRGK